MVNVNVFYKEKNFEVEEILTYLEELNKEISFQKVEIDILSDNSLYEKYKDAVPTVMVGPYQLKMPITQQDLKVTIRAAIDRQDKLENSDEAYRKKADRGSQITVSDRFTIWVSKWFMIFISLILFIYVGLPFLAPTLMEFNLEGPAKIIYTIYSPVCHQLAYRSFFLFGEQPYYPRALAHVSDIKTYEEVSGLDAANLQAGRNFLGDPSLGFKVAFCERDVAIYASMLFFALIFLVSKRKIKGIPWYLWVGIGMVPMGLDGGIQLFNFAQTILPAWFPIYESTPLLRVITGGLFGFTTAWYVFPIIEESMSESRSFIMSKMAVIKAKAGSN